MRYEAFLGFNTKQFWLYDTVNETYIDPPTEVLDEIEEIRYKDGFETADSLSAAESRLEEIANADPEPEWLHDGNEYPADDWEM